MARNSPPPIVFPLLYPRRIHEEGEPRLWYTVDRVQGARQCHEIKRRDCGWNSCNSVLALSWILDRPPTPSPDARHLGNLPSPPSTYLTHFHNPFFPFSFDWSSSPSWSLSLSFSLDRVTVSNTSDYFATSTGRDVTRAIVCIRGIRSRAKIRWRKKKKKKKTARRYSISETSDISPSAYFSRDTCCNYGRKNVEGRRRRR